MELEKLREMYKKYNLTKNDVYDHKHYKIITRPGIEKIQAVEGIKISYYVIHCQPDFAAIQATAEKGDVILETFGSAKHGDYKSGNSNTWYILEMAEKRAMSRAVLKITGFYELGVFGEDEADDFKKSRPSAKELIKNN